MFDQIKFLLTSRTTRSVIATVALVAMDVDINDVTANANDVAAIATALGALYFRANPKTEAPTKAKK